MLSQKTWAAFLLAPALLATERAYSSRPRITEISEAEAKKLMDKKWENLEAYKAQALKLKCVRLGIYIAGEAYPGAGSCYLTSEGYACEYRLGNMVVSDAHLGREITQWKDEAIEYALPSGIKVYGFEASLCSGPGMAGASVKKRLYNSKDATFWEGTQGVPPRALPFFKLVSPDGKTLIIVHEKEAVIWDLHQSKLIPVGKDLTWIPLLFGRGVGNTMTECGAPQIYSVKGRQNACIYTVDIKERLREIAKEFGTLDLEMDCIADKQSYYLITW